MDCLFEIGSRRLYIDDAPWTPATMPANFRPFVRPVAGSTSGVASLYIKYSLQPSHLPLTEPISESFNDLGKASIHDVGDAWSIVLTPCPGEYPRVMEMAKNLQSATLWISDNDPYADFVIDSMTRIFFSQHIALCGNMIVHASVVGCDDGAYMFMGKSGTGKSTHSRLWIENFDDCTLLNDDCPMIRHDGRGFYMVCGTPWSGKTPCWRDACFPLKGVARLRQAHVNCFRPLDGVDAFVAFLPGMSVMTADRELYSAASSLALDITQRIPVGLLECRPDRDAAEVCRRAFMAAQAR